MNILFYLFVAKVQFRRLLFGGDRFSFFARAFLEENFHSFIIAEIFFKKLPFTTRSKTICFSNLKDSASRLEFGYV